MNPFGMPTPGDYEAAFRWAIGFLLFIVLGGALLGWHWRWRPRPKNHWAYAGLAFALLSFVPVEQLVGSNLDHDSAFRLTVLAHRARYITGGLAVSLSLFGLIRMYWVSKRYAIGGQIAAVIGLVLGGLVGLFTYTQQMWPVQSKPVLRDLPTAPALRGGFVVLRPRLNFGFVAPSRDWSEEPELVRAHDAAVELVQRTLRVRTRVYADGDSPSLLALRDRAVAAMKLINPNVVVEKEEPKDLNNMSGVRILARAQADRGETRFFCTVTSGRDVGYRMLTWGPASSVDPMTADLEVMHNSIQQLKR
jgi:hypothetical protein